MSTWDNEPDEDRGAVPASGAATDDHPALPLEADEADALEQSISAAPAVEDERPLPPRLDVPLEASEADVIDQALSAATDDDDDE